MRERDSDDRVFRVVCGLRRAGRPQTGSRAEGGRQREDGRGTTQKSPSPHQERIPTHTQRTVEQSAVILVVSIVQVATVCRVCARAHNVHKNAKFGILTMHALVSTFFI